MSQKNKTDETYNLVAGARGPQAASAIGSRPPAFHAFLYVGGVI